ncbi:MPN domain-containing protein [Mycena kentingensis (nom. inval.)]|nr:MPN domain-containing protein [Mycena kentingensis (nom. inval.)]
MRQRNGGLNVRRPTPVTPGKDSHTLVPPTSAFPSHSGPYLSSASAAAARSAALAAANAPSPGLANVAMNSPMPRPVSMASSGSHTAQPAALLPSFGRSSASSSAPSPLSTYPSSGGVSFPQPAHHSPTTTSSSGSSYPVTPASTAGLPTPGPMPLRPLYEYDGESTDSEGPGGWRTRQSKITTSPYPEPSRMAPHQLARDDVSTSSGMSRLGLSDAGSSHIDGLPYNSSHLAVTYPSLARHMSTHQKTQGYAPGAWGSTLPPAAPAIPTSPDTENGGSANAFAGVGATGWGASQAMEAARAAAARPTGPAASYSTSFSPPVPQPPSSSQPQSQSQSQSQPQPPLQPAPSVMSSSSSTYEPERRASERRPRLKTVVLPQATLPRFLSIASANTSRNLETCGLLLGREVVRSGDKARFVVETLLVPKQHATSDTCTMDEEEAVLAFTEARGLITLGWIHTHPSQSCFMSSVDLHTHASFQCMLPESFAVVCAPKSDPTFGIFRLTDPPGLKTVLNCTEKQAFHPHPDVPIYTDADKGHVQMRDSAPLEIVDLR